MKKVSKFCDRYFVPDWRDAKRWYSTWAFFLIALSEALEALWGWLPHDLKSHIPVEWMPKIVLAVAIVGLLGRLVKQGDKNA